MGSDGGEAAGSVCLPKTGSIPTLSTAGEELVHDSEHCSHGGGGTGGPQRSGRSILEECNRPHT